MLPAWWKRGEALAALLSLLEQRRARLTEAATKVGAGLSAKERRTYWQASTEGSQARQQWTPELEATVKRNEQEAAD